MAAMLLAFALTAFLGDRMIVEYGDARNAAGRAEAQTAQLPAIIRANTAATMTAIATRDRIIAADAENRATLARLLPLILQSNNEVTAYATTGPGRAACLDAERVHGIEASRGALFPAAAGSPRGGESGPVSADAAREAIGRRSN